MGKAGTGAKAGAVAGIIYGIIDGVFALLLLIVFKSDVMAFLAKEAATESSALGIKITAAQLYSSELEIAPIEGIIGGLIIGVILGIIFAYAHNKIPGKNMIVKGEIFGVILWVIFDVLLGALDISTYGLNYYSTSIALDVIALLVFGFMLGTLYNKWKANDEPMTDEQFAGGNSGNF